MNTRRVAIVGLVVLAALVLIAWLGARPTNSLSHAYHNSTYGFSLRLPASYVVTEAPNTNPPQENGTADIIEFADAGGSVQLTITYASYAQSVLTTQSLLSNYPSLSSVTTEPFPIAPGTIGLALYYDPYHPNQISDVWFAKNGLLYQLTAFGDGYNELMPVAHTITLN